MSECLDLVDGLPNGSAYVRATCPERAWSEARDLATDIQQAILDTHEAACGVPREERTRIPRPYDALLERLRRAEAEAEADEAHRASEYIKRQRWEAV